MSDVKQQEIKTLALDAPQASRRLVSVRELSVAFEKNGRYGKVLDNVSVEIPHGKIIGLVGESGCGKTVLGSSIMGLLPERGASVLSGEILFYDSLGDKSENLLNLNYHGMKKYRGSGISMIFQEPMSSLNPVYTVGAQIDETISNKNPALTRAEVQKLSIEMLSKVGMPEPAYVYGLYPHQLSGGMRQRVVIAIAVANNPDLIIADEPTTALDITVSEQILFLLYNIRRDFNSSIVLITHDLGVVANVCDEIYVMYRGTIVEKGEAKEVFRSPRHPYTVGLLEALPEFCGRNERLHVIPGTVPSIFAGVEGCKFKQRCHRAAKECENIPPVKNVNQTHFYRCHL